MDGVDRACVSAVVAQVLAGEGENICVGVPSKMISDEYVNECGVVVGGLKICELIVLVEECGDKPLRSKFLRLLCAMYESNVDHLVLAYPPVRGKT